MKDIITFALVRGAIVFFGGLALSALLYVTFRAAGRCFYSLVPIIGEPAAGLVITLAFVAAFVAAVTVIVKLQEKDHGHDG